MAAGPQEWSVGVLLEGVFLPVDTAGCTVGAAQVVIQSHHGCGVELFSLQVVRADLASGQELLSLSLTTSSLKMGWPHDWPPTSFILKHRPSSPTALLACAWYLRPQSVRSTRSHLHSVRAPTPKPRLSPISSRVPS